MKRLLVLSVLFALLVAMVACSGGTDSPADGARTEQRFLSLGTAPPGGAFFPVGGAISEVLNEFRGDQPWEVTAEERSFHSGSVFCAPVELKVTCGNTTGKEDRKT